MLTTTLPATVTTTAVATAVRMMSRIGSVDVSATPQRVRVTWRTPWPADDVDARYWFEANRAIIERVFGYCDPWQVRQHP